MMTLSPELFILITVLPLTIRVTLDISKTIKVTPSLSLLSRSHFSEGHKNKAGMNSGRISEHQQLLSSPPQPGKCNDGFKFLIEK